MHVEVRHCTELMRLHVRALFTDDGDGRLVAANEPGGGPAPRFFLGRTAQGNVWRVRHDVDAVLRDELAALCEGEATGVDLEGEHRAGRFIACLARASPVTHVWSGPAFRCPGDLSGGEAAVRVTAADAELLSPYLDDWRIDARTGVPMAVLLSGGKAVAVCCSVRVTGHAHEAGVETHPAFRGHGHASAVVREWATIVRRLGCVPLYSTSWENKPSLALARKLGLVQFGADLHIT